MAFMMNYLILKLKSKIFPYYSIMKDRNRVILISEDGSQEEIKKYSLKKIKGLEIDICGSDNRIILKKPFNYIDSRIDILGDNALVEIGYSNWNYRKLHVLFSGNASNRKLKIGNNGNFFGPVRLTLQGSGTFMEIGDEFTISHDVNIYNNDNHVVINPQTREIINTATGVKIGNHVWIGHKASILKNVSLADNIIVGAGSIVTKSFNKNHVAIAGNPAKIVKENVDWDVHNQDDYVRYEEE